MGAQAIWAQVLLEQSSLLADAFALVVPTAPPWQSARLLMPAGTHDEPFLDVAESVGDGGGAAGGAEAPKSCMVRMKVFAEFLLTLIQVSRPGFYHWTIVMYILPFFTVADPAKLLTTRAICGLVFVTFPLNLLVYAMNDLKDVDIDLLNPRKGGCYGAKATTPDLQKCVAIALVLTILMPMLIIGDLLWAAGFSAAIIFFNWVYNFGPTLSRVPVLDMLAPLGYLLVIAFAFKVVGGNNVEPLCFCLAVAVVFRTQLWFQRMDREADAAVGKNTTARCMGENAAAAGVFTFMFCELVIAYFIGCVALELWVVYSALVFAREVCTNSHDCTMILMAIGALVAVYPGLQCIRADFIVEAGA
eukprot:NODE_770_length_1369_cov_329.994673.p1 GENE.NODE_770_length_1369_cov_329.994673~~NODE_770_length_1369_cov_329.994673.p1  ORF type:complete len:360 (-),score=50.00 NODE_770_length_1369_cov_329.994673:272-1351(-)